MKKIKKIIFLLIIIIMIIIGILIYTMKNKKISAEIIQLETQIVSKTEEFFLVDNLVQKYNMYLSTEEYEKAYSLLDKEYIEKYGITKETLASESKKENLNFIPQKIYSHELDKYSKIYFVKGTSYKITKEKSTKKENKTWKIQTYELDELEKREYKDTYYIVKIDYKNKTFSISKDIQQYENVFNKM